MIKTCDLFIVGGGPAGLSAAINAASEGLHTCLADRGPILGGQCRQSSMIRNYPGFPKGVTGSKFAACLVEQARAFGVDIFAPATVAGLRVENGHKLLVTEDFDEFAAPAVLLAQGLSWRRLAARGVGALLGRGVFYGNAPLIRLGKVTVGIVGGANSAGQAAVATARNPETKVKLLARRPITAQMSQYLIKEIGQYPNIEVIEGVEVVEVHGERSLKGATLADIHDRTKTRPIDLDYLLIFIGAQPRTHWLRDTDVKLDKRNYVLTNGGLGDEWPLKTRDPLPFETSLPGVFAAGDVRAEANAKRIAAASGEGSAAVAAIHQYLKQEQGAKTP